MRSDIYWIDAGGPGPGRVATSARPRGGDWLEDEVRAWQQAGVRHVVSLLTPAEAHELELAGEGAACACAGIRFVGVPVPDRGLPDAAAEFDRVAADLHGCLRRGEDVLVHCRQGVGRASLMAAAVLAHAGVAPESALAAIARARGRPVPDTDEQRTWLTTHFEASGGRRG